MEYGQYQNIDQVRGPAHRPGRRFAIIEFRAILGDKNIDHERPDISDKETGRGMDPNLHAEKVECKTSNKPYKKKAQT
jgi:hypothetical protein